MFQDAQVGTIEYQHLGDLSGKTLYMDLNKKTLTSKGVAFRVQWDKWKLNLSNGTVIGDTSKHTSVQGVIEVEAGGYLNVRDGTIQNKGANAPSIMVHGSSSNSGRGYAYIAGDEKSNFGSLFIIGGNVTVNGGTYDHAKVTYGGSLEVSNGKFQGDVIQVEVVLLNLVEGGHITVFMTMVAFPLFIIAGGFIERGGPGKLRQSAARPRQGWPCNDDVRLLRYFRRDLWLLLCG